MRERVARTRHSDRRDDLNGSFTRAFTFPAPVAADGVAASSQNGLLTITVTKAREAQPRRIEVKSK